MTTFHEQVLTELEALLEPLAAAAEDQDALESLLDDIGRTLDDTQLQTLLTELGDFTDAYQELGNASGDDPMAMLAVAGEAIDVVTTAADAVSGQAAADLGARLVEYLVLTYLQREVPAVVRVAVVLGVVSIPALEDMPPAESDGLPYYAGSYGSLDFEMLGELASDPTSALAQAYLPAGVPTPEDADDAIWPVMARFAVLFNSLGFGVRYGLDPTTVDDVAGVAGLTRVSRPLTATRDLDDTTTVGAFVAPAVGPSGHLHVIVVPIGSTGVDMTFDRWAFGLSVDAGSDPFIVSRDGMTDAPDLTTPQDGRVDVEATLDRLPETPGEPALTVGDPTGTRLDLGTFGIEGTSTLSLDDQSIGVAARATESAVTVAPGDGDGFVAKILPEDGLSVEFDAGIGFASGRGVYFEGGGGLDTEIPIQFSIGDVLEVPSLHLAARPDTGGETVSIPVEVSASPQVQLGPIGATVERIGLEADVTFPEGNDGNLGPVNVDLGFKPPTGAGLSVDASAVVGGGYLSFDPENERYSGTLQLQIGSLTLTAVGLLTTKFPDGRDGFSLLVIITGEFPAIQLGFGFTLNGLGGLLGINRGTKVEALRAGLRDGTTKSILFPKDPMRNAPRIVSDLRRVFPPTPARHVFGPMAKLGWGTPTIMTAEIGVLVSLPAPVKLVILGRLHAALPDDEAALVVFNMDAIGVIDFGAKEASIDATLYDSRIVAYTLTGDMAMRTNWGSDPDFALSVGGFHPKFDPPEGFPELRRIALTLGPGNPRIRWSGYFAITSNTVQAGAKVELYAAAAGFSVSGHLGFDALFQFDPFKLLVDIAAGFAIKRGGTTLLSAQLKGSLKGPNPWHVRGRVSFSIWPLSFSVNVDATFGERSDPEPLPPADVLGQVTQALGDERNWSAQMPEGGDSVVTLREIERESGTVLAHPLGTLAVRQQVAPLDVTIEKFGNARPATYQKYTIDSVSVAGQSQSVDGEDAREQFAPAQFFEMSDAEKLQRPSFERYPAGTEVGNALFAHGGMDDSDQTRTAELMYETSVVDEQASPFPVYYKRIAMPKATAAALTDVSAVARGPLRTTGPAKFAGTDDASGPTGVDASVSVSDARHVVARASDLRQVAVPDVPSDGTTRRETAEALDAFVADSDRDAGAYRVVASHEAGGPEVQP